LPEELLTVVKIPLLEIEEQIREKHVLPKNLIDTKIQDNALLLYFGNVKPKEPILPPIPIAQPAKPKPVQKHYRTKTRGWKKIVTIINSKGRKCAIYKPFVNSLNDRDLTLEEQRIVVQKILESNGNIPSKETIQYFLDSTLEYIASQRKRAFDGYIDSSLTAPSEETKQH
jgi:hypothetical protein